MEVVTWAVGRTIGVADGEGMGEVMDTIEGTEVAGNMEVTSAGDGGGGGRMSGASLDGRDGVCVGISGTVVMTSGNVVAVALQFLVSSLYPNSAQ